MQHVAASSLVAVAVLGIPIIASAQVTGTFDKRDNGIMDANLDKSAVQKITSKFSSGTEYRGRTYIIDYPCKGFLCTGDWAAVRLDATKSPKQTTLLLVIDMHYIDSDWRMYKTAAFVGGDTKPLITTRGEVGNCYVDRDTCSYAEPMGLPLSNEFLSQHAKNGLEVQISGNGAQNVIQVPAPYIQGFLAALDGQLPPPAGATVTSPPVATSVR